VSAQHWRKNVTLSLTDPTAQRFIKAELLNKKIAIVVSIKNRDIFYPNLLYHVYNKVVTGTDLFIEAKDYWNFMERYGRYFSPYFKTYS
jgi:hypothetical protein